MDTTEKIEAIEKIEKIIAELNLENIPLMEKPEEQELEGCDIAIFLGDEIHDYIPQYGDGTYWNYPSKKIENKVKDDGIYKVWYETYDASDPCDNTTQNRVVYIEEVNSTRNQLVKYFKIMTEKLR